MKGLVGQVGKSNQENRCRVQTAAGTAFDCATTRARDNITPNKGSEGTTAEENVWRIQLRGEVTLPLILYPYL